MYENGLQMLKDDSGIPDGNAGTALAQ